MSSCWPFSRTDTQHKVNCENTSVVGVIPFKPEDSCIICEGVKVVAEYSHLSSKVRAVCDSPKFIEWISKFRICAEIRLDEFHITDLDFFGPAVPDKLGFVKGFGLAQDAVTGDPIPAIAFIRGGAVAVLLIVTVIESGAKYVLMCKQLRFPAGCAKIEACAGMVDSATNAVVGVVFNEIKEETGFILKREELVSLGNIMPSAGGCDEIIHLYAWETSITEAEYNEKQAKVFGEGQYERIKLIFYPYDEFDSVLDEIGDVKAECCWRRYLHHLRRK